MKRKNSMLWRVMNKNIKKVQKVVMADDSADCPMTYMVTKEIIVSVRISMI